MTYLRDTIDSYNMWSETAGDQSYTFANLLPYFQKGAGYTPPNISIRAANASLPCPMLLIIALSADPWTLRIQTGPT